MRLQLRDLTRWNSLSPGTSQISKASLVSCDPRPMRHRFTPFERSRAASRRSSNQHSISSSRRSLYKASAEPEAATKPRKPGCRNPFLRQNQPAAIIHKRRWFLPQPPLTSLFQKVYVKTVDRLYGIDHCSNRIRGSFDHAPPTIHCTISLPKSLERQWSQSRIQHSDPKT